MNQHLNESSPGIDVEASSIGLIEKRAVVIFAFSGVVYTGSYLIGVDASMPELMLILLSIVILSFGTGLFCFAVRAVNSLKREEG